MKAFFSIFLVGMLIVCPALCQAAEMACCAGHCEESGSAPDDGQTPQSPNEPTSCICAGAIKDVKTVRSSLELTGSLLPLDAVFLPGFQHADPSLLRLLSRHGPQAPPGRPDSLRLHVLLMTFRC